MSDEEGTPDDEPRPPRIDPFVLRAPQEEIDVRFGYIVQEQGLNKIGRAVVREFLDIPSNPLERLQRMGTVVMGDISKKVQEFLRKPFLP